MPSANNIPAFEVALAEHGFTQQEIIKGKGSEPYNHNTYPTDNTNSLVIKPIPGAASGADRYDKLLTLVELAKQHGCALYPISTGKNWGYGAAIPTFNNAVLLDLSNFDQISGYNPIAHQVTVEPGVTQQALYEFLLHQGDNHWMDATGGPKNSSILGNTLEWGFGHTPKGEHGKNILNITAIIPWAMDESASIISSGLNGTFNPVQEDPRVVGLGPEANGLFIQSNLGIVLTMTLTLLPKPDEFCAYFIDIPDNKFSDYVKLGHCLRANGVIHSASHIGNKHKAIQMALKFYPFEEAKGETPLPDNIGQKVCKKYGLADWTASGGLYGTANQIEAYKADLNKAISELGLKAQYINDKTLGVAEKLRHFLYRTSLGGLIFRIVSLIPGRLKVIFNKLAMFDDLKALYYLKKGVPTNRFVSTVYWRSNLPKEVSTEDNDPTAVKAGFIWVAPSTPISPDKVLPLTDLITDICTRFKFEPAISLTLLNERAAECVVSLSYDLSSESESKQAMLCHEEIIKHSAEKGYIIYRLSTESNKMELTPYLRQDFKRLDLKNLLDPENVIAPDRYRNIFVK